MKIVNKEDVLAVEKLYTLSQLCDGNLVIKNKSAAADIYAHLLGYETWGALTDERSKKSSSNKDGVKFLNKDVQKLFKSSVFDVQGCNDLSYERAYVEKKYSKLDFRDRYSFESGDYNIGFNRKERGGSFPVMMKSENALFVGDDKGPALNFLNNHINYLLSNNFFFVSTGIKIVDMPLLNGEKDKVLVIGKNSGTLDLLGSILRQGSIRELVEIQEIDNSLFLSGWLDFIDYCILEKKYNINFDFLINSLELEWIINYVVKEPGEGSMLLGVYLDDLEIDYRNKKNIEILASQYKKHFENISYVKDRLKKIDEIGFNLNSDKAQYLMDEMLYSKKPIIIEPLDLGDEIDNLYWNCIWMLIKSWQDRQDNTFSHTNTPWKFPLIVWNSNEIISENRISQISKIYAKDRMAKERVFMYFYDFSGSDSIKSALIHAGCSQVLFFKSKNLPKTPKVLLDRLINNTVEIDVNPFSQGGRAISLLSDKECIAWLDFDIKGILNGLELQEYRLIKVLLN